MVTNEGVLVTQLREEELCMLLRNAGFPVEREQVEGIFRDLPMDDATKASTLLNWLTEVILARSIRARYEHDTASALAQTKRRREAVDALHLDPGRLNTLITEVAALADGRTWETSSHRRGDRRG